MRFDLDKITFGSFHGYIIYDESRALKSNDNWVVNQISSDTIEVRHRRLPFLFDIPLASLIRGLRRQSYVKTINVTDRSDFLINRPFDALIEIIKHTPESAERWSDELLLTWQKHYHDRKSHLVISRRFDMSAKGTCSPLILF